MCVFEDKELTTVRYDKARAIFDFLFGVKFHKTFPRVVRDASDSCGTGLYPASYGSAIGVETIDDWGSGVDVTPILADRCDIQCQSVPRQDFKQDPYAKKKATGSSTSPSSTAKKDKYITAPLKGELAGVCLASHSLTHTHTSTQTYAHAQSSLQTGTLFYDGAARDRLILRSTSFSVKKYEFVLSNIKVLSDVASKLSAAGTRGLAVVAGWQLGTPVLRSDCEDFVHVTVRERLSKNVTVDPKTYVPQPPLGMPTWISEADEWYIKLLGFTIKRVSWLLSECVMFCVCL